jgi:tetratricopeptide (TPR) repeat protein
MNVYQRKRTWHSVSFFVTGVCALFLFSGCAASKNMLSLFFGSDDGNPGPVHTASDDRILGDPDAGYQLARHFQKQDRHGLAVDELLKVVKADPAHANAYNALGVSYDRLREFDLAAAAYREALRIDPTLAYVHNNIGYSHLLQGNLALAADAFKTAVSLDSEKPRYQNNLALAHARLGNTLAEAAAPVLPAAVAAVPAPPQAETPAGKTEPITIDDLPENDLAQAPAGAEVFYTIQLGVFYDLDKAMASLRKAQQNGVHSPYINKVDRGGSYKPYYRVRAGKYLDRALAAQLAAGMQTDTPIPAYVTQIAGTPLETEMVAAQHQVMDLQPMPVIIRSNADIEILNGNGVRHMAKRFRQYLNGQGVPVARIANAAHFFHTHTVIYYSPGYYGQARQLLDRFQDIDATGKMVESSTLKPGIRIVLGRDMIPAAGKLGQNS